MLTIEDHIYIFFAAWAVTMLSVYVLSVLKVNKMALERAEHEVKFLKTRTDEIDRAHPDTQRNAFASARAEARAEVNHELTKLRLIIERSNMERMQRLQKLEDAALKPHVIAMLDSDDPDARKAAAVFAGYIGITGPLVTRARG